MYHINHEKPKQGTVNPTNHVYHKKDALQTQIRQIKFIMKIKTSPFR